MSGAGDESFLTVVVALSANALIAVAKTFINMIVGLSIDGFDIDAQAASVRAAPPAEGTPEWTCNGFAPVT